MLSVPLKNQLPLGTFAAHGNCCASKAMGFGVGVAKRANLVAVPSSLHTADIFLSYNAVLKDIMQNNLRGKAVVSSSISST